MIYGIIEAGIVAPKGTEAAVGYKELAIVTTKKIYKENTNRRQLSKARPFQRISPYQE